jgi:hypothetical protein
MGMGELRQSEKSCGWTDSTAGGDGSRQPDKDELAGARYLGARVANTASKLLA